VDLPVDSGPVIATFSIVAKVVKMDHKLR